MQIILRRLKTGFQMSEVKPMTVGGMRAKNRLSIPVRTAGGFPMFLLHIFTQDPKAIRRGITVIM